MKPSLFVSAAVLLCPMFAWAAPAPPAYPTLPPAPAIQPAQALPSAAPAPMTAAPKNANRVQGHVTAVDAARRTLTVQPHGAGAPVVVSLAPDAKVYASGRGTVALLKLGDRVSVYGQATPDAPTMTTNRIVVLPTATLAATGRAPKRKAGFHSKRVEGTIATLSPALTILTPGQVTVTVTALPGAQVETLTPSSFTDIAVGQTVQAHISGDPAAPVASEVQTMPAHRAGEKGKRKTAA